MHSAPAAGKVKEDQTQRQKKKKKKEIEREKRANGPLGKEWMTANYRRQGQIGSAASVQTCAHTHTHTYVQPQRVMGRKAKP